MCQKRMDDNRPHSGHLNYSLKKLEVFYDPSQQ